MSEQMAEQTSDESGSLKAALSSLETPSTPFAVPAKESVPETTNVDSPKLSPEQGGPGKTRKVDPAKADAPKAEAPKAEAPKPDAPADARRMPGSITIMSAGDRAGSAPAAEQGSGMFGKRRLAALAAVVALAAVAGALGGALATTDLGHSPGDAATTAGNSALEASVARIDADIAALKASVEHAAKADTAQFSKTSDVGIDPCNSRFKCAV